MSSEGELGARLRQARERAGMSQQEAADALGIARELISYWEHQRRTPSQAQLARLAVAYGITFGYLSGHETVPREAKEHALLYRRLDAGSVEARDSVRRWLRFLDDWANLLEGCGERLPGRGRPPRELVQRGESNTDSRRAPALAERVREHYRLGLDAIPDLFAFLDEQSILVYRAPLGRLNEPGSASGLFYNHPRLGFCICINVETTPGRRTFTLAHEFSHALFHHTETGLVSRADSPDRKERFADAFAGHFLVPSAALHAQVRWNSGDRVRDPFAVIRLQRYFRVSYATILYRLLSENLLTQEQYEEYREYSPSHLAGRIGLDAREYQHANEPDGVTLSAYPTSVLERIRRLVRVGELNPAAAASVLRVGEEAIVQDLLAKPRVANADERREIDELPPPPLPRRRRVTN